MISCPHFGLCGGCTSIDLPYEESLEKKEREIRELIDPVIRAGQGEDFQFEGILPSPVYYAYRNKMEFSFGDDRKDGPLCLGLHRKRSFYDIVTVSECRIVDEDFRRILVGTRDFFSAVSYYHRKKKTGYLRHLIVRKAVATGEILVDLVTTTDTLTLPKEERVLLSEWVEMLKNLPLEGSFAGILHTVNDSPADAVIDQGTDCLFGTDYFTEKLLGLRFRITAFSFFQTNSYSAEVLYSKVREYAELPGIAGGKLFDLYCGTGTIAQILAGKGREVIGVERVPEAVMAARENAAENGFSPEQVRFLEGDVLKVLDGLKDAPGMIVVDPPREGIHPKALPKILDYRAGAIIYVSCNPKSLARDLVTILKSGYVLERYCALDQFPHTDKVEAVCLLSNRKPDTKVRIDVDLEDYYRIKDAKKNQN